MRKNNSTGFFLLLLLLAGLHLPAVWPSAGKPEIKTGEPEAYLLITGTVTRPGVYAFRPGQDPALLLREAGLQGAPAMDAGGPGRLCGGKQVTVTAVHDRFLFKMDEMPAYYKYTLGIPLSLNQESAEGLCALPGIGPGLARRIVAEREKRGSFHDLQEVMAVKGIGPKTYEKIKPFLMI